MCLNMTALTCDNIGISIENEQLRQRCKILTVQEAATYKPLTNLKVAHDTHQVHTCK